MSEEDALRLLNRSKCGRLGCVLEDSAPYIVPINYLVAEEMVYMHSLPGQKVSAMRLNPNICLQIEKVRDEGFKWQSVVVSGEFEEICETGAKAFILDLFYEKFPRFTPVEAVFPPGMSSEEIIVFRIRDMSISGVSENWWPIPTFRGIGK
ncbi:MAG: pyridoxamine 5'-phosphate oxidase family protein [Pyrinomonadaceae bacterium]